jgi:hypothetical protein
VRLVGFKASKFKNSRIRLENAVTPNCIERIIVSNWVRRRSLVLGKQFALDVKHLFWLTDTLLVDVHTWDRLI